MERGSSRCQGPKSPVVSMIPGGLGLVSFAVNVMARLGPIECIVSSLISNCRGSLPCVLGSISSSVPSATIFSNQKTKVGGVVPRLGARYFLVHLHAVSHSGAAARRDVDFQSFEAHYVNQVAAIEDGEEDRGSRESGGSELEAADRAILCGGS